MAPLALALLAHLVLPNSASPPRFQGGGANIYWLGLDENAELSTEQNHVSYPFHSCVVDALDTAKLMGARLVRSHTLGISVGNPLSFEPELDVFNDTALEAIDYAVAEAHKRGLRLQVPLIDNWKYYHGGRYVFTNWLNKTDPDSFYTDSEVIGAFKRYITALLNHTSSVTGVRYGSDPTVLVWETGNELSMDNRQPPPVAWTAEISEHIKSLSPDAWVMDGTNGINEPALAIESVDVYTRHFYPGPDLAQAQLDAQQVTAAGKLYIAGEFGWKTESLDAFLDWASSDDNLTAFSYWSLFPHRADHGFVQHGDKYTLHYPYGNGHESAVQALRKASFAKAGTSPPPAVPAPPHPEVTLVSDDAGIAWRGAAGAANYTVQASKPVPGAAWTTICDACAEDNADPIPIPSPWTQSDFFRVAGVTLEGVLGEWSLPGSNLTL